MYMVLKLKINVKLSRLIPKIIPKSNACHERSFEVFSSLVFIVNHVLCFTNMLKCDYFVQRIILDSNKTSPYITAICNKDVYASAKSKATSKGTFIVQSEGYRYHKKLCFFEL